MPIRKLLLNPWFLIILGIKLIIGSLFAADVMVHGFIPFVNYFVSSGLANPYNFFVAQHYPSAFPYPPMMLFIFALVRFVFSPFLTDATQTVQFAHLLMMRLPLVAADIMIYLILCKWLETKEQKVLWLYWASPILFFINYFHGQLDVIPMAILFISLVCLFNNQVKRAMILLGIGLATKTHLLAVLPFYTIYLLVNRYGWKRSLLATGLTLATFLAMIAPWLWSSGFITSVFGTDESAKVFLVNLSYQHNNLKLLLAPALVLMLFFNFYSYQKLNKDAFLLILGLLFTIFVVVVPPMPGWFYWSIPFFVYFFAKYERTPKVSFVFLNIGYLLYFIFAKDAAIFSSFQLIAPQLLQLGSPFALLEQAGVNMILTTNIIFTLLITSIIMNTVWIYRRGVHSNLTYKVSDKPLVLGIGGDSGAGKNTLATELVQLFGEDNMICVEGDDAHKWERNHANWKQYTHLNPKSNHLYQDLLQTAGLKDGQSIKRSFYDHSTGRFTLPNVLNPKKIIVYVGLHPFYLKGMRAMFDIKIYIEPDEQLRRHWKLQRDASQRGKTAAEVLKQLEAREADATKYIRPQREFADIILTLLPKGELVPNQAPAVKLRITCDNSFPLDPLMEKLNEYSSMSAQHWYEDDLERQCIEFDGALTAAEVSAIGLHLLPNLEELTTRPQWQPDYAGIRQLFILYYYSETQRRL